MKACVANIVLLALATVPATAQDMGTQLWLDYDLNHPLKGPFLLELETSYQTLLSKEGKWRSISVTPTVEYTVSKIAELVFEVPFAYTFQTDTVNTIEWKTSVGTGFHLRGDRMIEPRVTLKWESRFFKEQDDNAYEKANRLRVKGDTRIRLRGRSHNNEKVWYARFEGEIFFVMDRDVSERYANRARFSLGVEYRLNYYYRFEGIYMFQESRNKLEHEGAVSQDNIIRLRFKHYFK